MLNLIQIKRTDPRILQNMAIHYSQPKGFVGRNICYAVMYGDTYYGSIVGGSATLHLPNRNEFFDIDKSKLNNIVNNIFFHIEKQNGEYPCREFATKTLKTFRQKIYYDWLKKYGDILIGHETLVELPRTGDCYKKDGWTLIGQTTGYTCKRVSGVGTDNWTGKRVWDTKNLRPKLVFAKKI
jgi:DnaJ-class molecular chaperone